MISNDGVQICPESESKRQLGQRISRTLGLFLVVALLLSVLVLITAVALNHPQRNLWTNLSSAKSEMRDVAEAIDEQLKSNKAFLAIPPSPLFELPEQFNSVVHSGDGKPIDPFQNDHSRYRILWTRRGHWWVVSPGPDRKMDCAAADLGKWGDLNLEELSTRVALLSYDPTNGNISSGDLFRQGEAHFSPTR